MTNEELVALIQAGKNVEDNTSILWDQLRGIIMGLSKQYATDGLEQKDLVQEAYFSLLEAIKGFNTHAENASFQALFRFILRRNYATIRNKNRYARLTSMTHHELSLIMQYHKFQSAYKKAHDNRYPTNEEYMEALGITEWKLNQLQTHIQESTIQSLSTPVGASEGDEALEDIVQDGSDFAATIADEMGKDWADRAIWDAVNCLDDNSAMLLTYRYKKGWQVKNIAEKMHATPEGLYCVERNGLKKLRENRLVQEAAEIYGYNLSTTHNYNRCGGDEWNRSPVEALAIKHLELENRLSALKERMVSREA